MASRRGPNYDDVSDLGLGLDKLSLNGAKKFEENPPKWKIVYFDVQTTGLKIPAEVIQLAARYNHRTYCNYIMPRLDIPHHVVELTGLVIENHRMLDVYNHHRPVSAVSKEEAIESFLTFLRSIGGNIIMVAYNCLGFDAPMLIGLIDEVGELDEFKQLVVGFSGVLPLLRREWKGENKHENGLNLRTLAEDYLGEKNSYNDSSVHVQWLQNLVNHRLINIPDAELARNYKPVKDAIDGFKERIRKAVQKKGLRGLGLENSIIDRFVEHNIGLGELSWYWECEGPEYVESMITRRRRDRSGRVVGPAIAEDEETVRKIMRKLKIFFRDTRSGHRY